MVPTSGTMVCPGVMLKSFAALMELSRSAPALARPITLAFEACACSMKEEKSEALIGWLITPNTFPPERAPAPRVVPSTSDLPRT